MQKNLYSKYNANQIERRKTWWEKEPPMWMVFIEFIFMLMGLVSLWMILVMFSPGY